MNEEKIIRLAGIAYESLVNGPGMRRVLFSQGCVHNCEQCFNQDTHSFDGGELRNMDDIIKDIIENPILRGVTFSGGDPWEQAEKFEYIAKELKKNNINIWSYTGYTYEFILKNINNRKGWKGFLNNIDVLVDGKFDYKKKDGNLKFKGSSNQRIIDVRKSLESGKVVLFNVD